MPAPVSRRTLLAAAGLAPAALFPARPRPGSPGAEVLAWYDLTTQAVAAAAYPEPVTQSRVWAIGWLAAARAAARRDPRYAVAAFASALHDALAALSPTIVSTVDAALAAGIPLLPFQSPRKPNSTLAPAPSAPL